MEKAGVKALREKANALGVQNEKTCTGCAQSTLAAIMDTLGIEGDDAFKAASGLADGIGLTGDGSCGALTGGVLAIGLACGRDREHFKDPMAAMDSYMLAKRLHHYFMETYGTCRCREIQTKLAGRFFDLMEPGEMEAAMKAGVLEHCSGVVGAAAAETVAIIESHRS